jgi:hypothetical protein
MTPLEWTIFALVFLLVACFKSWRKERKLANQKAQNKAQNKKAVAAVLSSYFRALDVWIDLLKRYRIANEIRKAGDVFLTGIKVCDEIREYIAENIGTTEAAIFGAKGDEKERIKGTPGPDFYKLAIGDLTNKLLKLKEIMEKWSQKD